MPENTVTHEQLRAGQMAMLDRFDVHEKRFHEVTVRLFDKLEQNVEVSHSNALAIAKIDGRVNEIVTTRTTFSDKLDKIENTVSTLVADGNRREGERGVIAAVLRSPFIERGVIAAVLRSPFIAWFAALGAVIWAAVKGFLQAATPLGE